MIDPIEIMARAILEAMLTPAQPRWERVDPLQPGRKIARAALSALERAGYVVVPVEPTEAIRSAYNEVHSRHRVRSAFSAPAYRAMIQAAQVPHDKA